MKRFFLVLLLFALLAIIFGSITYIVYNLSFTSAIISAVLAAVATFCALKFKPQLLDFGADIKLNEKPWKCKLILFSFNIFTIITALTAFLYIYRHGTVEVLQSPWQVAGIKFYAILFVFFFLISILAMWRGLLPLTQWVALTLAVSIALFVYKLGFGFDTHIHEAALKIIDNAGIILPKTFYYSGAYAAVILMKKILGISLIPAYRILVPIVLPLIIVFISNVLHSPRSNYLILGLLLSPFLGQFIVTTPFAFSLGMILIEILILSYIGESKNRTAVYFWAVIFATVALFSHPISGIPALIIIGVFAIFDRNNFKVKVAATIFGSFSLPLIFIFTRVADFVPNLGRLSEVIMTVYPKNSIINHFSLLLNATYIWKYTNPLIYLIIACLGIYVAHRSKTLLKIKPLIFTAIIFLISGAITLVFLQFKNIIYYEAADFGKRIIVIAGISLFPFFIRGITGILRDLFDIKKKPVRILISFILTIPILFNIYGAYPRIDKAYSAHSYNTSIHDMNAVQAIEKDANGAPYAVLANQQVSAAAIKLLGFERFVETPHGQQYIYPIPTGGVLYKFYLEMAENYKINTAEIMNYVQVPILYAAINDYWWRDDIISEKIAPFASRHFDIDNGKLRIFVFER